MKEWRPEKDFGKADFAAGKKKPRPTDRKAVNETAQPITTDALPGKTVRAWRPPAIGEVASESSEGGSAGTPEPQGFTPLRPIARLQPSTPQSEGAERATADLSGKVLEDLILARPRETADLLRRWYWEKPAKGTHPHARIFILLHSMRNDLLVNLYGYFTALERRQMQEIYSSRRNVAKIEILQVRRLFMDSLANAE